jgi:hypothetical protein
VHYALRQLQCLVKSCFPSGQEKKKQHISVHYNYVLSFRKDSLLDIAIKINNEQQDIKPSSGSQPKERTILILGSKSVVSIVIMTTWFLPLFVD